jgi:glycogen operon protein
VALNEPDWSEHSHSLAFTLTSLRSRFLFHCILNAYWEPLRFALPSPPAGQGRAWRRCIDTALAAPDDLRRLADAPDVLETHYLAQPRSVVLLAMETQSAVA